MTTHKELLTDLRKCGDVQRAAEYLASLTGIDQQNAMDEATECGFRVAFYANSIRVYLATFEFEFEGQWVEACRAAGARGFDRNSDPPRIRAYNKDKVTVGTWDGHVGRLVK